MFKKNQVSHFERQFESLIFFEHRLNPIIPYMKTIPLQKAYQLLESADAIIVENQVLFSNLKPLTGSGNHTFLHLEWETSEGLWHELQFTEGDNPSVTISGPSLFLHDTESTDPENPIKITILEKKHLE
jgi:hypothetical protein